MSAGFVARRLRCVLSAPLGSTVRAVTRSQQSPVGDDDRAEASSVLRAVLEAVQSGEIEAEAGQATALRRRLEGAVAALEAGAGPPQRP